MEFFPNTFCVKYLNTRTTLLIRATKDYLYQFPISYGHQMSTIPYNKAILSDSLLHDRLGHPYLEVKHIVSTINKEVVNSSDTHVN